MKPGDLIIAPKGATLYNSLVNLQHTRGSNPYSIDYFLEQDEPAIRFLGSKATSLILEIRDDWCLRVVLIGANPEEGWTNILRWQVVQEI